MSYYFKNRKGFFSLLGLLLAVAIILFLGYTALNTYFRKPALEKSTKKSISEQGIDSSNYQSVLDSTKKKVKDIEKELLDRSNKVFDDLSY